jgi:hypothetical protein
MTISSLQPPHPPSAGPDSCAPAVAELVQRYLAQRQMYESQSYLEAQLRVDFLDPLWLALGWDVSNRRGLLPHLREVIVEPPVADENHKRRADYAFRKRDRFSYLVEAKRPGVSVDDPTFIYQAKLYAWCSRCPIVVLTNFRQWRTYVIEEKPDYYHPRHGRIEVLSFGVETFSEHATALNEYFSQRAVLAGGAIDSLAKRAQVDIECRAAVDQTFVTTLLSLRRKVGECVSRSNADLQEQDLDLLAQVILDRLMFLRVAEDRRIMLARASLATIAGESPAGCTDRVKRVFEQMRRGYNGSLFQRQPVDEIELSDADWRSIVLSFVPPALDFRLDAFPDDFLGTVYERYMGLELARDARGGVILRPCPQRIRSRGAHYTPRSVVRYMVEKSVGQWLWQGPVPSVEERSDEHAMRSRRWRSFDAVSEFRILDPACGSGAFLLAAFDYLLDWYLERARWKPESMSGGIGVTDFVAVDGRIVAARPRLKALIAERHLFGIDVDGRAVEVARTSLYLRILEDTGSLFPELHLPSLSENLRCGNTLVPPSAVPTDLSDHDLALINPWDPDGPDGWTGRFDVVVGNPPYVFGEFLHPIERRCYENLYALTGQVDLFKLFFERTISRFLKPGGLHSFIVPDAIMGRDEHTNIRRWLVGHVLPIRLCHVGPVFLSLDLSEAGHAGTPRTVGVSAVVLVSTRRGDEARSTQRPADAEVDQWTGEWGEPSHRIDPRVLAPVNGSPWAIHAPTAWHGPTGLRARMSGAGRADRYFSSIARGEETGKSGLLSSTRAPPGFISIYAGEDLRRHVCGAPDHIIETARVAKTVYTGPKILFVKTGAGPVACRCDDSLPTLQSVYVVKTTDQHPEFIDAVVGVLCSAIVTAYCYYEWTSLKLLQPQFTQGNLGSLPMPEVDTELVAALAPRVARIRADVRALDAAIDPAVVNSLRARMATVERELDVEVARAFGLELEDWLDAITPALNRLPVSQRPRWWARGLRGRG